MSRRSDVRNLTKALRAANATPIQIRMAATLLAVNGLENALAHMQCVFLFVRNVAAPRDTCAVCGVDNGPLATDGRGRYRHGLKCWSCGCP
jgi:hypothetical protein